MYYRLKEQYCLRGWQKLPWALVNRKEHTTVMISRNAMEALMLCNGRIDTTLPLLPQAATALLPELEKAGIIERCEPGAPFDPKQEYRCYPARYIQTAHWSITGRCNYRCRHCYMWAPEARLGELDHQAVMDIVEQLAACGIMNVSLTGGEPLVRRDFWEIVDALLARDIRITTIYSNGKLVTDAFLDQLEQRGIRPEINMSFDGIGYHDWLRGVPGAEKAVEEAFLRCKVRGIPTGAEMCISRRSAAGLRASVKRLAAWGCAHLKVNPIGNVGAWKEGGYGEAISCEELYRLYLDYIPQYYADGMPLTLQLGGFFWASPRSPETYEIPLQKDCRNPDTMCLCGHARSVLYISAEGRALPCMALSGMEIQKEFPLIREKGLAACLTDSRYMRLIDTRATEYFARNPACKTCRYALQCLGGCRASALESTPENILGPDPYACALFTGGWIDKIHRAVQAAIRERNGETVNPCKQDG